MGSSAGAGSGEFHVYRHLRRKEYARQKSIQQKCVTEKLDQEYRDKIEANRALNESKTAKKRAKRLKRKQRMKENAKKPKLIDDAEHESDSDVSNEDDVDEENEDAIKDKLEEIVEPNERIENDEDSQNKNIDEKIKPAGEPINDCEKFEQST